jgi:hypothetical protein
MANVTPINQTERLANPFRLGNGVPPPVPAGGDDLLAEFERFLGDIHLVYANWTLTEIRRAVPDVQNVDQAIARLLERSRVYRASRARCDFSLPLFRANPRRRAGRTYRSRTR